MMGFGIKKRVGAIFEIDRKHKANINYLKNNGLFEEFRLNLININLNRTILLSTFAFFLILYTSIMDYFTQYSSHNMESLEVYRMIDPIYTGILFFIHILARLAKTYSGIGFTKAVINVFLILSIAHFSMVSSIEQFEINYHPSFLLAFATMAILFYSKPPRIILLFLFGFFLVVYFNDMIGFSGNEDQISYVVTISILPLSVLISKVNFNSQVTIFTEKSKLNSLNLELETKVRERTTKLQETNEKLQNQIELQKKYEVSLKKAKEKAENSDHLKSAFLSNLSHEIRTPLNSIIGFSSLMNNPNLDSEKKTRYTDLIASCGKELIFIIDQLVEMSKIESGNIDVNKVYFMINDLMFEMQEKTIERMRELKKDHMVFSLNNPVHSENPRIYSDLIKIRNVMINLIENAIKFTDKGKIEIGCSFYDNIMTLSVKDTGIGISEKDSQVLFKQFAQAEAGFTRKYGGLGIGLSISKTYVDILGGKLWFESIEGEGSTFYFSFPVN